MRGLYSQLSEILDATQYASVEKALGRLLESSIITASKLANSSNIDINTSIKVLQKLVDEGQLTYHFVIRCPECGFLIKETPNPTEVSNLIYCYSCEQEVELTTDNIEVAYRFKTLPFDQGQHFSYANELERNAAHCPITLTQLIKDGYFNIHDVYYNPAVQKYEELQNLFSKIFDKQCNTKSQGDTLEKLTECLFNASELFRAAGIRLHPNQIDCYVRKLPLYSGQKQLFLYDSFFIECKNENDTPGISYLNKLHSILQLHKKKFGIIISKMAAPKTFVSLAHKIYLKDDVIIISMDGSCLRSIIFNKINLLECIDRKIEEVRLDPVTDLISAGLFDG